MPDANPPKPEQKLESHNEKPSDKAVTAPITKSQDNDIQQRIKQIEGLAAFRVTNNPQNSFAIAMENGDVIKNTNPIKDVSAAVTIAETVMAVEQFAKEHASDHATITSGIQEAGSADVAAIKHLIDKAQTAHTDSRSNLHHDRHTKDSNQPTVSGLDQIAITASTTHPGISREVKLDQLSYADDKQVKPHEQAANKLTRWEPNPNVEHTKKSASNSEKIDSRTVHGSDQRAYAGEHHDTPQSASSGQAAEHSTTNKIKSVEQISAFVRDHEKALREALDRPLVGISGLYQADSNTVLNIVAPMSFEDRQALMAAYQKDTGHDLMDVVNQRCQKDEATQIGLALNRPKEADYAGSFRNDVNVLSDHIPSVPNLGVLDVLATPVQNAVNAANRALELDPKRQNAEVQIIDKLMHMTAKQIGEMRAEYTKEAAQLHDTQHTNFDKDIQNNPTISPEMKELIRLALQGKDKLITPENDGLSRMTELALKMHRPDVFNEMMRNTKAREEFATNPDAGKKISEAFGTFGSFGLFDHGKAEALDYAKLGREGLLLKLGDNIHPYQSNVEIVNDAIKNATPEDRKKFAEGWALFAGPHADFSLKDEKQIDAINYYRTVTTLLEFGKPTVSDKQISLWEAELRGQQPAFESLASKFTSHKENVMDTVFMDHTKAAEKIEALAKSAQLLKVHHDELNHPEKERQREVVRQMVAREFQNEPEKTLASDILKKMEDPNAPSIQDSDGKLRGVDRLFFNRLAKCSDEERALGIEGAVSERKATLEREHQTPTQIHDALAKLISFDVTTLSYNHGYGNTVGRPLQKVQEFVDHVARTGHLPYELSSQIATDSHVLALNDFLSAPKEQKLPDGAQGKFLKSLADEGKRSYEGLSSVEKMRAFALGLGDSKEHIEQLLAHMQPSEVKTLAEKYSATYGHDLMTKDVLAALPPQEQWRYREMLSMTAVSPQQQVLDAEYAKLKAGSAMDPVIAALWDGSKCNADEYSDRVQNFLDKYQGQCKDPSKLAEFKQQLLEYRKQEQLYVESKKDCASALIDSTIAVASAATTIFGPEVSLPLLAASGAGGALGAIGITKAVEGGSYDDDPKSIALQAAHGFIGTVGVLATAEVFGAKGIMRVSESAATHAAEEVTAQAADVVLVPDAKRVIATHLRELTQVEALTGQKGCKAFVEKLARQVVADPKNTNALEKVKGLIMSHVKIETKNDAAKSLALHADRLTMTASSNMMSNSLGVSVTGMTDFAVNGETPEGLLKKLPEAVLSGMATEKISEGGVGAATVLIKVDELKHVFVSRGALIAKEDGRVTVSQGKWTELEPNERLLQQLPQDGAEMQAQEKLVLPTAEAIGHELEKEGLLEPATNGGFQQNAENCWKVAASVAQRFGFEASLEKEDHNEIIFALKERLHDLRFYGEADEPAPSQFNLVVRQRHDGEMHVTLEAYGKEYNFGANEADGFVMVGKAPLRAKPPGTPRRSPFEIRDLSKDY